MAHFAKIVDGTVQQVDCVANEVLLNSKGEEKESLGIAHLKSIYGQDTEWVQTSFNGNFRGKFAGFGYKWDGTNFVSPEDVQA